MNEADEPWLSPSLLLNESVGRNMMFVMESGVHSTRAWALKLLPRENDWFTLLENEPTVLT